MTCPHFQKALAHLVALAQAGPGWRQYTWARAQALDAEGSGLYRGMAAALTDEMRKNNEKVQSLPG